jgi:hypothetical protein
MINNLSNEAILGLSASSLVASIQSVQNDIQSVINEVKDVIAEDLAAFNAVKGLLQALLRLFNLSCRDKSRNISQIGTDGTYLAAITVPNPYRQGCSATTSDFADLIEEIGAEFNEPDLTPPTLVDTLPLPEDTVFVEDPPPEYVDEPTQLPGDPADILIDGTPDLPPVVEDPCAKPC